MFRRAAVATALGLLAACSLVPGYESPDTGAPAAWQESGQGAGVWPDAAWWKGFGSPELDGLIADAAAGNLDLAAAVSRVLESEAQAKIAGAPQYPSLDAGAGVSRSKQPNLGGSTFGGSTFGGRGAQTFYNASLSAAYEVDLWEKNRAAADAAVQRVRSSQFDQETVAITLDSNVATTYFQILSLRDRVRLAEDTLKSAEGILDLLERQRRVGTVSDLEVAQQRTAVATQRAAIPALVQTERQAIHALAILLGRNPEGFAVESKSLDEARLPAVGWAEGGRRGDVEALGASLRGEIAEVRGEIAELRGQVSGEIAELRGEVAGILRKQIVANLGMAMAVTGMVVAAAHLVHVGRVIRDKAHGIMVSPGIDPETQGHLGFEPARTPQQALEMAFAIAGSDARGAVLRHGGDVLPLVTGNGKTAGKSNRPA